MRELNYTESHCTFETKHLLIRNIIENNVDQKQKLAGDTLHLLTSKVTEFLPDSWQDIKSIDDSLKWIEDRQKESTFLNVKRLVTGELIGFIFIYEPENQEKYFDLMFGYLLSEACWGKGYGTELIKGLVNWSKNFGNIKSLSGGVATKNTGSVRVLEKCGFISLDQDRTDGETMMFKQEFNTNFSEI
ncbi:MAG: GNAT family N-acetyltransferase [Acidaminobacteraceae bacterium]